MVQDEDDDFEPIDCPDGSAGPNQPILCAPGFEPVQITRDGCMTCEPVEDDCNAAERCRASGQTIEECLVEVTGSRRRAAAVLSRARSAGISAAEALNAIACDDGDDDDSNERRAHAQPVDPVSTPDRAPSR